MTEQVLDVRRLLRAAVRHRLVILGFAVVGIAVGLIIASRQPSTFVARSVVLLPPAGVDARGNLLRDMVTEIQIASSTEILDRVGTSMSPTIPAQLLRKHVSVRAISTDLLEMRTEWGSPQGAVVLADGVAEEYVQYSNRTTSENSGAEIDGLVVRAEELDARISQLEADIVGVTAELAEMDLEARSSTEGVRRTALVDSLRLDQADTARQLSNINNRIAEARLDAELRRRGTRVLQPAIAPTEPASPRPLVNAAVGGLVGLVQGVGVAVVRHGWRRRLAERDDIADVVAAPVLASIHVPPAKGVGGCRELLEHWEPDMVETWALRQAVSRLGLNDKVEPTTVVVVALAGDRVGVLAAAEIAIFIASSEIRTALVVTSHHPTAADLRAACHVEERDSGHRPYLSVHGSGSDEPGDERVDGADVIVSVVITDGGSLEPPAWPRPTLTTLAVSSGFATADLLATTALTCVDSGQPILGVFLANPDPSDQTTGRADLDWRADRHLDNQPPPSRNGAGRTQDLTVR